MDITRVLNQTYLAVLSFTQLADNYVVAVETAKKTVLTGQSAYIVSNNYQIVNQILRNDGVDNYINAIPYGSVNNLLRAVSSLIIFDDLDFLLTIDDYDDLIKNLNMNNNFKIALINYPNVYYSLNYDVTDQIDKLTHLFNKEPLLLFGCFASQITNDDKLGSFQIGTLPMPKFVCKQTVMTMDQLTKIEGYRSTYGGGKLEYSNWTQSTDEMGETPEAIQKVCNILYPFEIQSIFENNQEVPDFYSLVRVLGYKVLFQNSPKFLELYDTISLNLRSNEGVKQRHIIHTGFNDYFGGKILKVLFDSVGENPIKTLYISNEYSSQYKLDLIRKFNDETEDDGTYKYQVLIINNIPPIRPTNVNHFHILDVDLREAYEMVGEIFKYTNYNLNYNIELTVYFHFSLFPSRQNKSNISPNSYLFNCLNQQVQGDIDTFNKIKNQSYPVVLGNGNRLSVRVQQ